MVSFALYPYRTAPTKAYFRSSFAKKLWLLAARRQQESSWTMPKRLFKDDGKTRIVAGG